LTLRFGVAEPKQWFGFCKLFAARLGAIYLQNPFTGVTFLLRCECLCAGEETVNQPGGTSINMLAETHFQMNYNTGEWRRIKKYRTLPVDQQAAQ
jgi:hypothetical protein